MLMSEMGSLMWMNKARLTGSKRCLGACIASLLLLAPMSVVVRILASHLEVVEVVVVSEDFLSSRSLSGVELPQIC